MLAKDFQPLSRLRYPHMEGRLRPSLGGLVIVRPFLVLFAIFSALYATKNRQQQILLWIHAGLSHMTGSNSDRAN
ncbi:hypothetical protein EHZ77_14790 [Aeromonas dhakensis]|nr:hypothetical protein EHZ77_14790 [Aeromonas dhakensis]